MDESQHHVLQADLSEFLVEGQVHIFVFFLLMISFFSLFICFCLNSQIYQVLAERDKYWKIDIGDIEIQRRSGTGSFAEVISPP